MSGLALLHTTVDLKYDITHLNIRGKTDFYTLKYLKWQKGYLTTYMDGLSTRSQRYFNQEGLPITYHNFRHQSLVRLKSKSSN